MLNHHNHLVVYLIPHLSIVLDLDMETLPKYNKYYKNVTIISSKLYKSKH